MSAKRRDSAKRSASGDGEKTRRRRLWLFRCSAATLAPVVLLLAAELSLRAIDYGHRPAAIVRCQLDGRDVWCDNIRFGWRFFPRRVAREFVPFVFPEAKPENSFRIFVLGASAVKGEPDSAYSFGRILRTMLRAGYPGTDFEVISVAMPAINSHVVVEIAKDCVEHQPDLFVIYLGNNEVMGPYGIGTVFAPPFRHRALIRAAIALEATRVGQLLTHTMERVRAAANGPPDWQGLEMFLRNQIPATDRRLQRVYEHFQANLTAICDIAVGRGSQVILCTVGSNLKDCPPFASLHGPHLDSTQKRRWETLYGSGIARETAGNYEEAIRDYLAASEMDGCHADLQFRLGRSYEALADYQKAKERYTRARELDALRFRADGRINDTIRVTAEHRSEKGVHLVDAVKVFEADSPHGIPGKELFYEHVHMNFRGNYVLAKALAEQVGDLLPQEIRERRDNTRPLLSEVECARLLAYTDYAEYNNAYKILHYYIKKAPFNSQLYHEERVREMEARLTTLQAAMTPEALQDAVVLFENLLEDDPSDFWLRWRYAELLSVHVRDEPAAAEQCRMAARVLPCSYRSHLLLGLSLERLGRWDEAALHLSKAVELKPTSAEAQYHLGMAYQSQGRIDDSIACLSRVIALQPKNPKAYMNLAIVLSSRGETERAVRMLRAGTRSIPHDPVLHFNLAILLARGRHTNEAIEALRTAQRLDPNSAEIRSALDSIMSQGNEPAVR